MKNFQQSKMIKIINISIALLLGLHTYGQLRTINTNASNKNRMGTELKVVTKVNIKNLKEINTNKKIRIDKLKELSISKNDLAKRPYKTLRITPLKPNMPGLSISYHGGYSKEYFTLRPKSSTGFEPLAQLLVRDEIYDNIFLYSGRIVFNARRGKEYRVKITTVVDQDGLVIVNIGNTEHVIALKKKDNEIAFVFWSQQAGDINIKISPLLKEANMPYEISSLPIRSIKVEEI